MYRKDGKEFDDRVEPNSQATKLHNSGAQHAKTLTRSVVAPHSHGQSLPSNTPAPSGFLCAKILTM